VAHIGLSLKGRALRLLSGREHSRAELERKLQPHEDAPGALEQVLDGLEAKGFISEQRVVESVLHRRAPKLGMARIRQELQGKGLNNQTVSQALQGLQATELQRAQAIWRQKFSVPAPDAAGKAKQARFLMSRGFAADVVRRVVAGLDEDED
jgi:regulatory protein